MNRHIFTALATVGVLGFLVKAAAAAKEVAVAGRFGVGDYLDAFLVAYLIPAFAVNVVAGSFGPALVPAYTRVREQDGPEAAQRLVSSLLICGAALSLVTLLLLAAMAPYVLSLVGSQFSAEKLVLARRLFFVMLPLLPLSGAAVTCAALLNAGQRFALAAAAPVLTPLAVVLFVCGFGAGWGVYALAAGVVVGACAECAVLAFWLRRCGVSLRPRWHGLTPGVRQAISQYAPALAAACTANANVFIDQAMSATLGAGGVSTLGYAARVPSVVVGTASLALSTVLLPQFSRLAAAGDWAGVRRVLKSYGALTLVVTIPVTAFFYLYSRPIIGLLFERGAFLASDAERVASVQRLYMLQLPFYATGMLLVPLFSALRANHVLLWGALLSFTLNVTLDNILMRRMGIEGIALATSVVFAIGLAYKTLMAARLLRRHTHVTQSVEGRAG